MSRAPRFIIGLAGFEKPMGLLYDIDPAASDKEFVNAVLRGIKETRGLLKNRITSSFIRMATLEDAVVILDLNGHIQT